MGESNGNPPAGGLMDGANSNQPAGGDAGGSAPPARPDHIPEKFWDAKAGAARVDDLAKSYVELEKHRGKVAEEAKAAALAEVFGKRPEAADKYEVRVPSKVPDGLVILEKAPDADFQYEPGKAYAVLNPSDPLFQVGRQLAFKAGLSQDEFDELAASVIAGQAYRVPTAEEIATRNREMYAKLGENGEKRVAHAWGWLKGTVGEAHAKALDGLVTTPEGLAAMEELMIKAGGSKFSPQGDGGASGGAEEAEAQRLIAEPDYTRNPEKQQRVAAIYAKLYGGMMPGEGAVPAPFARG